MMKQLLIGILMLSLAASASAEPAAFARIGQATSQPEYHSGKFKAFGWGESTAFCGLRDANLEGAPFVGQDASWWLAYDKEALYLVCMTVLAPQGEHFLARTAADNDPAIFQDDHLLIQIGLDPQVGQAGVPFLRVAVNPNGAIWAETVEALPGQNHPLDTGRIAYGNHVGDGHVLGYWWYARLRIPLDLLEIRGLQHMRVGPMMRVVRVEFIEPRAADDRPAELEGQDVDLAETQGCVAGITWPDDIGVRGDRQVLA